MKKSLVKRLLSVAIFMAATSEILLAAQGNSNFYRGGDSSGGGRGVFCSNTESPHHGRLLDLYESYALWQLTPLRPTLTYDEAARLIAERMADVYFYGPRSFIDRKSAVEAFLDFFLRNQHIRFIPNDQVLLPISDSMEPIAPVGCEIKQLALFYSNQLLLVDRNLWVQLRDLDKVALLAHEYIYYNLRVDGDIDSRYARRLIGKLFSQEPFETAAHGLDSLHEYYNCSGGVEGENRRFDFIIYDSCVDGHCRAMVQFLNFASMQVFEKTTDDLNWPISQLQKSSGGSYGMEVQLGFKNYYLRIDSVSGLNELKVRSTNENGLFEAPPTNVHCEWIHK